MSPVPGPRRFRAGSFDRVHDAAHGVVVAARALETESRRRLGEVESLPTTIGAVQEALRCLRHATDALAVPVARGPDRTTHENLATLSDALQVAVSRCEHVRRPADRTRPAG